jgi:hypothetical protein
VLNAETADVDDPEADPPASDTPFVATNSDRGSRADRTVLAAAGLLVLAAVLVGAVLNHHGRRVYAPTPPLFALLQPHVGWGTPIALLVAIAGVLWLPRLAQGRRWPTVLVGSGVATLAWTTSLALSRGWAGITEPLTPSDEYLVDVSRVHGLHTFLRTFDASISGHSPDPWSTHVAGGPPGMLLIFVGLRRIGLGGPVPAALLCLAAAALSVPLVVATTRLLCGEHWARLMLPFAVLMPAAIWAGVSADALLAAVGAGGLLLLAVASVPARTRRAGIAWALSGGALLGVGCFLSYGAGLMAVPALGLLLYRRRPGLLVPGATGALLVAGAFTIGGFWWPDGYHELLGRYYDGLGSIRPYRYWIWADAACLVVAIGPAVVVGLRRTLATGLPSVRPVPSRAAASSSNAAGAAVLTGSILAALLVASLTGLSKAEVERIWLPWEIWLPIACAALPPRSVRAWLSAQVVLALLVEHLLITPW